jgi:hypothetical protein
VITNDVQCRNTRAWLAHFEAATLELEAATHEPRSPLGQAKIDGAYAQANDLRAELAAYEARRSAPRSAGP